MHARASNRDLLNVPRYHALSRIDRDLCLELQEALLKFSRPQLSFSVSPEGGARKHLWTRQLGQRFPTLRDRNRLAVDCESSEKLGHSRSNV